MNADTLRDSVLQKAMEGKLVPQLKEEAEVERIGDVSEEAPFEIPKKWKWVNLELLCHYIQRGKSPIYSDKKQIPVIAQKCNQWDGFSIEKAKFIEPNSFSKYTPERRLQDFDILWNSTGLGTLGRLALYETRLNPYGVAVADSHVTVIRTNNQLLDPHFLYWFLRSPAVQHSIEQLADGSTKQKELATKTIKSYLIPVPSIDEQKRIVKKIEELLPLIEEYGRDQERLEKINKDFPVQLEKSLLHEAISGKIVPQRDDEPEVEQLGESPEEVPFEIPKKWKWVRMSDILTKLTDGEHKTPKYREEGVPFLSAKNISSGKIDFSQTKFISKEDFEIFKKRCNPQKGDILLSKVGTTGVPAIVEEDRDFGLFVSVALLKPDSSLIRSDFLYYQILSPHVQQQAKNNTRGVGNKNWVLRDIAKTLVVLPPLEEQKRIVEKLDKLMLEIQKLK